MKFVKSNKYDKQFMKENMMGPNSMKILEEMISGLDLREGMRVLDLGCGKGLTSIFLAKELGVTVYATDLWITATENYERFKKMGLEDSIIPIHANAFDLPYAEEYFDAAVCVDAYLYFGTGEKFMDDCLAPLVKPGGVIAVAVPGLKEENPNAMKEIAPYLGPIEIDTFHSGDWWGELLSKSKKFKADSIIELTEFDEVWNDWLECDNEYAIRDRDMIKADGGRFMNLISIVGKRV